jgi:uncharacterized membrane protein
MENQEQTLPLITNDAVVLGLLLATLAIVFRTAASDHPFWKKFFTYVPSLLLCYFIPSIYNSLGIISGEQSNLYYVASRYLLPASLVLFTLSMDVKAMLRLGPKAIIMFLTGTIGIIVGGPLSILIVASFAPDIVGGVGPDAVWRGMATIAGSWIGGGANQAAMLEVFGASSDLFAAVLAVDIIIANIWLGFLLYGSTKADQIDNFLKADTTSIREVKKSIEEYVASIAKIPSLADTMMILGIGFGATAIAHIGGDLIAPFIETHFSDLDKFSLTSGFFWIVVIATALGLMLSFTKYRELEGAGASRMASVLLYVLIATIGMQMDITAILSNPGLFMVGAIWMLVHISLMLIVAKLIKAPFFFVAVGSQANVGGAASAPIVASAFSPSLAPVGVLLAVFGYFVGTYGAWLCGILMQTIAP